MARSEKNRLSVKESWPLIEEYCNVSLHPLLDKNNLHDLSNKGKWGHILERLIGIGLNSESLDLTDGEIKTFKRSQSIAITMVDHVTDEIIECRPFKESYLYNKIKQTVMVPRVELENHIFFAKPFLWNEDLYPEDFQKVEEDWNYICDIVKNHYLNKEVMGTGVKGTSNRISTTVNGPNEYLQIRTGGNSNNLLHEGQVLSEKKLRFYFKDKHMGKYFFEQRREDIEKTISKMGWR